MSSEKFSYAFEKTIGHEGGYVNHPSDPGGETKYGITKRDYPYLDIKNLTIEEAKDIYYREYWMKMRLDGVDNKLVAAEMFDTGINTGPSTSITFAQRSVNALGNNITVDGYIGPVTISAINKKAKTNLEELLITLNGLQLEYYVSLAEQDPKFKDFFVGWVRKRVQLRSVA